MAIMEIAILAGCVLALMAAMVWLLGARSSITQLERSLEQLRTDQNRLERLTLDEFARSRDRSDEASDRLSQALGERMKGANDSILQTLNGISDGQRKQLEGFSQSLGRLIDSNEKRIERVRMTVEQQLRSLQDDNGKKLEQMRQTVDEKLQGTLEKRLGDSFKLVSTQLEQVHRGLGEMQNLAVGVGDLKRVLSNVKTRGTWGEILLENLLEQVLAPEQYQAQASVRTGSRERVDFVVRLPGASGAANDTVLLPIDAKFPKEDYERLLEASEHGDAAAVDLAAKALEMRVRQSAKELSEKYIEPPITTDFAVLFLASEGLYAEVLRRPGLTELLQNQYRVTVAGPTTLAALLNSLQMGFRTLAIQKRSSEVWTVLGAVKTEFGRFGDVLGSVQKKLNEASNHIDKATVRTRAIEKKLKGVEELPSIEARALIGGETNRGGGAPDQIAS